ncbi:choline transporter-like protein [Anaeramoeba ignava]|uniref:Choline transporter-like protein n=1 Tax=Anaeramoeba ignava TaxID=1746090 RepID=A0A9Q0LUC7_ANAIG|nr:choline transporter-like protein [Anaeramoeba ignava]
MKSSSKVIDKEPTERFEYEENFQGPIGDRKYRDVFCLIVFVAFWVGMFIIMAVGFATGTPKRLYYPKDYRGNICGMDNTKFKDKLTDEVNNNSDLDFLADLTKRTRCFFPYFHVDLEFCVEECPSQGDLEQIIDKGNCNGDPVITTYVNNDPVGQFCSYKSDSVLRRCLPSISSSKSDNDATNAAKDNEDSSTTVAKVMGDFVQSWWVYIVAIFAAVLLSFAWILLVKKFSGFMVWLTVILFFILLAVLTWYFHKQWKDSDTVSNTKKMNSDSLNAKSFKILFWIMIAVDILAVIIVIWLYKRIILAVALIEEAATAIKAMPRIVFFPLITFVLLLILYAYSIAVAAFLLSSGKPKAEEKNGEYYLEFENTSAMNYLTIYHFFGLLWTNSYIIALTQATIAGAIASCLNGENRCVKYCFYCMKCFLACLHGWMKFINKNGYIMIAVYGESFWKSTKRAFHLISRNILRVLTVSAVGDFLLFLGKFLVAIAVGIISLGILRSMNNISFYLIPTILCAVLAYAIASAFMSVFEMAIDTMLLCFCEDAERHDGSSPDREPYASERLQKYMNKNKAELKNQKEEYEPLKSANDND